MPRTPLFHPLARQELFAASDYTALHWSEEFAAEFEVEFHKLVARILEDPMRYRARHPGDHRRVNLKRFPYHLIYFPHEGTIWIVALAHHSQRPFYWRDRLGVAL
ncbi:MAG: type II toxin-antitoxin system RelE/ParE family toxin [Verrucomicrobiales bacterium]